MSTDEKAKRNGQTDPANPFGTGYIGNIWGWKFSYISLGVILFFMAFIALRYWYLDIPFDPSKFTVPEDAQLHKTPATDPDTLK